MAHMITKETVQKFSKKITDRFNTSNNALKLFNSVILIRETQEKIDKELANPQLSDSSRKELEFSKMSLNHNMEIVLNHIEQHKYCDELKDL